MRQALLTFLLVFCGLFVVGLGFCGLLTLVRARWRGRAATWAFPGEVEP